MASGDKEQSLCQISQKSINNNDVEYNKGVDKCRQWLNSCNLSDSGSSVESSYTESEFNPDVVTEDVDDNEEIFSSRNVCTTDKIVAKNNENLWDNITKNSSQYKNIQVYKSQNVHIGNVTHIHGPVYVNQFSPTINQNILITNNTNKTTRTFPIVPRRTWLAQPPLDPNDVRYFTQPPKFVIINHSASEEAYTQTDNNLLVRLIQQFHVESYKWNDIGYNFLAGADGSIFEGRGWKVVGAHTFGYNSISIGIAFVGCYMRTLPPRPVLEKVKDLIRYGVEIGAIAEDYVLLGHRQCRSSESPGSKLFEEIKTWDRWDGSISVSNPSPLMIR